MNKVVHFEIPVDDWDRAKKFYKENFGWDMMDMNAPNGEMAYVMLHTAQTDKDGMVQEKGAINGGLFKREDVVKVPVVVIGVQSIEESLKKIEDSGGKRVGEIMPIPNGRYARAQDSEGNIIGLGDSKKF